MFENENSELTQSFAVFGLQNTNSANVLKKAILAERGVVAAGVDFATEKAFVRYKTENIRMESIVDVAAKLGACLQLQNENTKDLVARRRDAEFVALKFDLIFCSVLAFPLLVIMSLMRFGVDLPIVHVPYSPIIQFVLATPVMVVLGYKYFMSAITSLFSISTLAVLGSFGAFLLSIYNGFFIGDPYFLYLDTAVIILIFVHLGKFFDMKTKRRIASELSRLVKITAKTATLVRDNNREELIDVESVCEDDILTVKNGEQIVADGVIISGGSSIDESMLTGVSVPIDKKVGDKVYAGTFNITNPISVSVSGVGEKTELSRIVRKVEDVQSQQIAALPLVEKISRYFIIGMIVLVVVTAVVNFLLGKSFPYILPKSISVLIISCPCALALVSSMALMVGTGVGLKYGILFRSGGILEILKNIRVIVLGKTDTITSGKISVCELKPFYAGTLQDIYNILFSLSCNSNHPIAKAITEYCERQGGVLMPCTGISATSSGIKAAIDGNVYSVGTYDYSEKLGGRILSVKPVCYRYESGGEIPYLIMKDGEVIATISFAETIRDTAKQAVAEFHQANITVYMLTQDSRNSAMRIANYIDIPSDKTASGLSPEDKADAINAIMEHEKATAMVGNGINDTVALSASQIGISIGKVTDKVIGVSDVVIKNDDLLNVCRAIGISRNTTRIITQNLFLSCMFNFIGIPFALMYDAFDPAIASLAMVISSVSIFLNSLRIENYKFDTKKEISFGLRKTSKIRASK